MRIDNLSAGFLRFTHTHVDSIYIIFYTLLLEKAPKNAEVATNIEIEEETENEYKVKEILDINKISRRLYYLVK
jgi:hypothetical protein